MRRWDIAYGDEMESPDGDWVDYDDVQRMRARLLVKLLRERKERIEENYLGTARQDGWGNWFATTADRIEERYL